MVPDATEGRLSTAVVELCRSYPFVCMREVYVKRLMPLHIFGFATGVVIGMN